MATPPRATRSWKATRSSLTRPRGAAPSKVADLMIRFLRFNGPSRASPKTGARTVPGPSVTGSPVPEEPGVAHGGQHVASQVGVAHDEVGQPRVGSGVAEGGPVAAAGVEAAGQRHRHRRARVPLVLAPGVHVHPVSYTHLRAH